MHFNPRSPRGGATRARGGNTAPKENFNPRSPRGGATFLMRMITSSGSDFNPRSPRGGATLSLLLRWLAFGISIHAPHEGERQMPRHKPAVALTISIHAPHEGERHFMAGRDNAHLYFNPRSPRGGATLHGWAGQCTPLFQSTLPTRGSDCKCHVKMGLR